MSRLEPVLQKLSDERENALKRFCDFLRIPSVSTDPAYRSHVQDGANWVAGMLREIGLEVTIEPTPGHPVVLARGGSGSAGSPHVLYYGHYDVQPPDPIEKWHSPPFEPTIRDDAVYARGASDDKGQVCCFLEALRAWQEVHGDIPVSVTVLIEGEEECGSDHLPDFVTRRKDQLVKDPRETVAVVSDTAMWDTPTDSIVAITYGLRGLAYYDIQLHGPDRDLHSGVFGGTLANPATTLAQVLGHLFDDRQRVTIPEFYDDVTTVSEEEYRRWAELQFDESAFLGNVDVDIGFGEADFDLLTRRWGRPSCDVNGLYGGYGGDGAKTIIPSFAGAKVSFRLAPNQRAAKICAAFETWIKGHSIPGCRWKLTPLGMADPVLVTTDSPFMAAAAHAVETTTGQKPMLVREGATIPIIADFKTTLGIDSLLIGFGRANDHIHAPNEKFDLNCFEIGCRTHAAVLAEMADLRL